MCSDCPKVLVGEICKGIWKNPVKPKCRPQKEGFFHDMDKATRVTCVMVFWDIVSIPVLVLVVNLTQPKVTIEGCHHQGLAYNPPCEQEY